MVVPLMVEGLTDADFNARAPLHPDDVPTAREIRLRHNTWMAVGFFVSTFWLHLEDIGGRFYVPVGFVLAIVMGLLIRDTAKTAREHFALPLFLLISFLGSVAGVLTLVKGWL
jgi:hypothetical protein